MKLDSLALIILALVLTSGSCDNQEKSKREDTTNKTKKVKLSELKSPSGKYTLTIGEEIPVELAYPDSLILDSALVFLRGQEVWKMLGQNVASIPSAEALPGRASLRVKLFFNKGRSETHSTNITLLSDLTPRQYRYRVVNTYPHDVTAYTQGLQYYKGLLYEGTGQETQSTVRKVRLEDGEVLKMRANSSEIFGEGITIFRERIYQLTYKARVCFIYDLNTLEEVQKVFYQNREGWGLTNDGKELIMSDGTHILYFLDPDLFTVNRQLEIYDDKGPVKDLNELEYIKGKIWANRYYSDEIVIIDPVSGKLEGRINLKGILKIEDRKPSTNVLNGIAWDPENDRIFVTGKYWPKLFEIEVIPLNLN